MHHLALNLSSKHLGQRVSLTALLPEIGDGPFATLYLLHGLSDDHTIWTRQTALERHAANLPLAIVMPQGFRGFYTRNEAGPDYVSYLLHDVIGTCERLLPLRRDRGGRSIGGLSMGGYGALRVGLAHPDRFTSIGSHSGALGYGSGQLANRSSLTPGEYRRIFGEAPAGTDHDLVALARRANSTSPLPAIAIDCGVDDFLIEQNRTFHIALEAIALPHAYAEHPGEHNWAYWDARLPAALAFHASAMGIETTVA